MRIPNPLHAIDFYKADHRRQYPAGTEQVYSNLTPRSGKLSNIPASLYQNGVVFFGLQYFVDQFLQETFNEGFFDRPKAEVVAAYKRRMDTSLGKDTIPVDHIESLHDLGYLPIAIRAVKEGTFVPIGVPMLVIYNTHKDFFWLTNYLETVLSANLWQPITSATTAFHYKLLLTRYANSTGSAKEFVKFQGHDFSARGMPGIEAGSVSGMGHLTSFVGTDTVSAIDAAEFYYNADADKELVGCSVPASEHSVASSYVGVDATDGEYNYYRRAITELYPKGIVSLVSDTYDFWNVLTNIAARLKPEIMARDGKVVFRPDSGDPANIICGDPDAPEGSPAYIGAVECLWNLFGGTTNAKGFKTLDSHVGLIYGDSITHERAEAILSRLAAKGFAADNIVFGIGSYTYQHVTRDTHGMAVKSTAVVNNSVPMEIFKDPATDIGKMKKSLRGYVNVSRNAAGVLTVADRQPTISHPDVPSEFELVYENGTLIRNQNFSDIRAIVDAELEKKL